MVVIRVGGERNGEWSFDDYGSSVWENKKVLEMDGGYHWTTVEISLMPLNYTLKNVYDSTFYVNTYTHTPLGKMGRLGRKKWGEMREIQTSKGAFLMVGSSCSRRGCLPWIQQTLLELHSVWKGWVIKILYTWKSCYMWLSEAMRPCEKRMSVLSFSDFQWLPFGSPLPCAVEATKEVSALTL